MRFKISKFTVLWFPKWFSDAFLLRRHPTGKLWLRYRFRYNRTGKEIVFGPITIGWGDYKWMA